MTRCIYTILALISMAILSSCAQLNVNLPNPRIEAPETRGEPGWKFTAEIVPAHNYESTDNGGERPPDFTQPDTHGAFDHVLGASFSPYSKLDLGAELNVFGTGVGLVGKFQILGDGLATSKQNNFPVAVFARVGRNGDSNSGDQRSFGSAGGSDWSGELAATYSQVGISFGHRVSDRSLIFAGGAVGKYGTKTSVKQDPEIGGGGDPGGTYKYSENGHGRSAGGGVLMSWRKVQFSVGGEYSYISYQRVRTIEDVFFHGTFSWTP